MRLLLSSLLALTLSACNLTESLSKAQHNVRLHTDEPLKIDMTADIKVYHYDDKKGAEAETAVADSTEAARRKYNRQKEIQDLKNARLVAETHRGRLLLREQPAGSWGAHVKKTVDEENVDRDVIMRDEAQKQRRELHEVAKERYEANVKNAFPGEWIEIPDPEKPDAYLLKQKEGTLP
jgi:hypothetical protein